MLDDEGPPLGLSEAAVLDVIASAVVCVVPIEEIVEARLVEVPRLATARELSSAVGIILAQPPMTLHM